MIKSLLDADENPPPGTKVIIEETIIAPAEVGGETPLRQAPVSADAAEISQSYGNAPDAVKFFETPADTTDSRPPPETFSESPKTENKVSVPFESAYYEPESSAETIRKSGLAYAAAITLFAAVVFMMVIGWGADLLFGTSPWGVAGGIVLGALVGFFQFFRMTAQILKNKD